MNKKVKGLILVGILSISSLLGYGCGNYEVGNLKRQVTSMEKIYKEKENELIQKHKEEKTKLENDNKALQEKVEDAKLWFELSEEKQKQIEKDITREKAEKEEAERKAREEQEAKERAEQEALEKSMAEWRQKVQDARALMIKVSSVYSKMVSKKTSSTVLVNVTEEVNLANEYYAIANKENDKWIGKNTDLACAYASIMTRCEIILKMADCSTQSEFDTLRGQDAYHVRSFNDSMANIE